MKRLMSKSIALSAALVVLAWTASSSRAGSAAQKGWDKQAKEYRKMAEMARAGQMRGSVREQFRNMYAYVAEQNKEDYERNAQLARKYAEKAAETKAEDGEKAKKYMTVAKAFRKCAQANKQVWDGYKKGDNQKIEEGFAAILAAEKVIKATLGKRPERDWLTPNELGKYIAMQEAKKERKKTKDR